MRNRFSGIGEIFNDTWKIFISYLKTKTVVISIASSNLWKYICTVSDTNWPVQIQKVARNLKFGI